MTRLLVDDPALGSKLLRAQTTLELCDASGLVLGRFVPAVVQQPEQEGEAALARREKNDGGADFWKSLGID
jgi:hypothetical protein